MGKLQVELIPAGRRVEIEVSGKVRVLDVIRSLGLSVEGAIVTKDDGKVLAEDELLSEGESVKVYLASSGG